LKILLVAATVFEIAPVLEWLKKNFQEDEAGVFHREALTVFPLVTGIGVTATACHLGKILGTYTPDLAINVGIAGAFDRSFPLGAVVHVVSERFGDLGVEEADGRFTDLFELGFISDNQAPFTDRLLHNPKADQASFLPVVHGLTVQKVHGFQHSIEMMRQKYPEVQIESMEGAAFFYVCLVEGISFLEIRSISNYVEPRNRAAWQIPLAIQNLNNTIETMLNTLGGLSTDRLVKDSG
jgi:futalosine hydrolase